MTRAVIYARVSSQVQKDRHTIAAQLRALPDYVARQGWHLVRPAATYVDDGRSAAAGTLERREAFARLVRDAQAGAFDVVVVVDLDRLTRSDDLAESGYILGAFQRAGVNIATPATGLIELGTFLGRLLAQLQAGVAADWLDKHRRRVAEGKLEAIRRGRKPAGPTPFGLAYDRGTGVWAEDPARAAAVREINRRVIAGEACETIGRDFEGRGVPPARRGRWSREAVWRIATSPTYRGEWIADKRRRLTVPVPRLVSDADWFAAQDALNRTGRRGLRRTKHVYLVEGIGVCELCGGRIGIATHGHHHRRGARLGYYVCGRRRRPARGEARCALPMRRVDEVDGRLWRAVVAFLEAPGRLERAIRRRRDAAAGDAHDWAADLRAAEAKLRRSEERSAVIADRYRRGRIPEAAMDVELSAAARERAMLQRQIDAARSAASSAAASRAADDSLAGAIERLRSSLRAADPATRRGVVRDLVGTGRIVLGVTRIRGNLVPNSLAPALASEQVAGSGTERQTAVRLRLVA